MNLKPIKQNMTVLEFDKNGQRHQVLFSYQTPVAYSKLTAEGLTRYKTDEYYSRTTTKHINSWFHEYDGAVSQNEIDNLVSEVK